MTSREPDMVDRSLSILEAAEHLGCSTRTIRRRIKDGQLQAFERPIPRGFEWRILLEEVGKLATEGRQTSGQHDTQGRQEARQEPVMLDTQEEPAGAAEEAAHFDDNVTTSAEPGLLKALEVIETLQREHRQELERLQQENKELYGRASFFQAKLQDAQERILMLEAQPAEEEQKAEPEPEKPSGSWWRRLLRRG